MEAVTKNEKETQELARSVLEEAIKNGFGTNKACVFALSGELGSGKTAFVKGLAETLLIKERVLSPTFVIERRYRVINRRCFSHLIHIDAYRLSSSEELKNLGWEALIGSSKNLICLEWPENVSSVVPSLAIRINFEVISENERRIIY